MFAEKDYSAEKKFPPKDFAPPPLTPLSLLLLAIASAGTALLVQQSYRYWRGRRGRSQWKSRSRHPQVARWEDEGGEVPRVAPLQSRMRH